MKGLFIQDSAIPQFGVMCISAILKKNGHQCNLILNNKDVIRNIRNYKPDIILFSCTTGEHKNIVKTANLIKKYFDIPTIIGGPHATFFPEIIKEKGIDIVCIGEGDYAMLEIFNKLEKGKDITKIKNLWIKKRNKIYKNPVRHLIENLDELPFPDRGIYYNNFKFLRDTKTKMFISGRGCPFNCTFCFNHSMMKLYKNKGKYVRKRSTSNLIEEIKYVKRKYGFKFISFSDDTFVVDKDWLSKFCKEYKKTRIPFMCNIRANLTTEKMIKELKEAGCYAVAIGIESGNENIRNKLLKKQITDKQIIYTGKLIKKYRLKLKTYNMLGYPGETINNAIETVKINSILKPDQMSIAIIQPYPGTEFYEYVMKKGYLNKDFNVNDVPKTLRDSNPLRIGNKKEIENLQSFAFIGSKYPFLIPFIKQLIKLPPNKIYKLMSRFIYGFYMSRLYKMNLIEIIKYVLKSKYKFA